VGIFLGQRGLPWVDPLAGAFVALLILRTGIFILRESSVDLMDAVPSSELAAQITQLIKRVPGVEQLEELQAHRFGPHLVINLTIGIEGSLSVRMGDSIATKVEGLLCEAIPNLRRVHVHYHPAESSRRICPSARSWPKAAGRPATTNPSGSSPRSDEFIRPGSS
jgi:divalent metal cation (Fe/Co/Zn/Cd) transporter